MMAGTEIMTIADLDDMEARVDIGEMDIVLIEVGQKARLEVDAFKDKKFIGEVYEIANAAKGDRPNSSSGSSSMSQQEATKFEVKIRVKDKEKFRPGMSVTSYVETRSRTNVLTIPIQSVTTRLPKAAQEQKEKQAAEAKEPENKPDPNDPENKKKAANAKPIEVAFVVEKDEVRMVPVKRGINDDDYVEIVHGLNENQVVVSGGYKVINRELEDGKKIVIDNEKAKPSKGEKK
jgi:HlyD family secretion protein